MSKKRNQPWLPEKPQTASKCPKCKGSGKMLLWAGFYKGYEECTCKRCGGKGYL